MHVRVCRECGEEYRPEVVVCSDCGGALEDHYEGLEAAANLPAEMTPAEFATGPLVPVASAPSAAEIEPLGRRLGQAGIRFAVRGSFQLFELLVAADEQEPALAVLEAGGEGSSAPLEALSVCPACGTALRASAVECPECGLGLGGE